MAKPIPEDDDETIADDALAGARGILERVTGEKLPNRARTMRAAAGGAARAAKLTSARRSQIAAKASSTRWKK